MIISLPKHLNISRIKTMGIEMYLHTDEAGKEVKRRFEISPLTCSLKHLDEEKTIRQFLKDAEIDTTP